MTSKEIINKSEKLKKSITELKDELESIRIKINSLHLSQSNLVKGSPEERKLFETEDVKINDFQKNNIPYKTKNKLFFIWSLSISSFTVFLIFFLFKNNQPNVLVNENNDSLIQWGVVFMWLIFGFSLNYLFKKNYKKKYGIGRVINGKKIVEEKKYYEELEILRNNKKKNIKKLKDELNTNKMRNISSIRNLDKKYKIIEDKISVSKTRLTNYKKLNEFIIVYDKNDNGKLDIAETTNIDKLLTKHQKDIRKIEKVENTSFIPDLVKINNYLNDYQNNLVEEFKILASGKGLTKNIIDKTDITSFDKNLNFYKILISSLVLMIESIVNDNHILYFKLRESMDKYGIFDSNFQKNQIALMKENNQATSQLIKETKSSKDAIIKSLESVEGAVGGIQDELWDINMKLV